VRKTTFLALSALLFVVSVAATVGWSRAMATGMTVWLPMPGQTRLSAATGFEVMWVAMMAMMMLPSLVPTLARTRVDVRTSAGYLAVWAAIGAGVYVAGVALSGAELRWPTVSPVIPIARGVVLVAAGWVQLTLWKARHLECYREGCLGVAHPGASWRRGIALGGHCALCCLPFMAVLMVVGMMNLAVIALLALAITIERVVRAPALPVRFAGLIMLSAGVLQLARAV
jgi:predicted metal-binding membrane protein